MFALFLPQSSSTIKFNSLGPTWQQSMTLCLPRWWGSSAFSFSFSAANWASTWVSPSLGDSVLQAAEFFLDESEPSEMRVRGFSLLPSHIGTIKFSSLARFICGGGVGRRKSGLHAEESLFPRRGGVGGMKSGLSPPEQETNFFGDTISVKRGQLCSSPYKLQKTA